jgi:DNA-directed RNA polymerase specialized sigma24 family protein
VDEVLEFCRRVLLDETLASEAAAEVAALDQPDRLARLAAAGRACRERGNRVPPAALAVAAANTNGSMPDLGAAVARELSAASSQLAERHRETLALRELLGLSYGEIATVIGVEPSAVAPLLARARLRLRMALRGPIAVSEPPCDSRDRALRALARRQDGQPTSVEDEDWLLDHMASCPSCERDHAAMLESAACYRGWRDLRAPTAADG